MTGDMIYVVLHMEDRGGIMAEKRSDMMMMLVVPTQIFSKKLIISLATYYIL